MTTFDRREEAFENLFAHDEALRFRAEAYRAKHLAQWAAALMGRSETEAEAYSQSLVSLMIAGGGDDAILRRLSTDLDEAGVPVTEAALRERMEAFMAEAVHHVRTD